MLGSWRRRREAFPAEANPYSDDPPEYVVARDGKRLPVDHTLRMARSMIEHDAAPGTAEKGLALALEAALMAVKNGVRGGG
jgi:hypothetical protein